MLARYAAKAAEIGVGVSTLSVKNRASGK